MRKGFTLIELLVLIVVIPFVLVIIDGLFRTLLTDIPWSCRIVQENTTVLNMLEQLHQDIDKAKGLPKSSAGHTASDEMLLIKLADGVICYQIEDGQVLRRKLTDTRESSAPDSAITFGESLRRSLARSTHAGNAGQKRVWSVPNARVKWTVWTKDGEGYAVETRTYIEHEIRRRTEKKLANSHVYFLRALQEDTDYR
jgi:type II secretory pathway component PulJ